MFSRRSILAETVRHFAGGTALASKNARLEKLAYELSNTSVVQAAADAVNVIEFGADPTGNIDSSDAIARAIQRCFSSSSPSLPKSLYFPGGRFLITRNNLLHSSARLPSHSWTILGAGRPTTLLIFKPAPTAALDSYYLYDGLFDKTSDANMTLIGLTVFNLGIQLECSQLSASAKVNCFRQFGSHQSGGPEQNWSFINCSFRGDESCPDANGSILEIGGDANGSENAFINCRGLMFEHVIDCLNPQAVNHLSLFCHWEVIVGDMFRFIRGGNLTLYGGSLILNNLNDAPEWKMRTVYAPNSTVFFDGRQFRTNSGGVSGDLNFNSVSGSHFDGGIEWTLERDRSAYLLRVGGDLTGQINTFLISGARIELRSNKSKLIAGGDLNTGALITFDSVAVQPVVGGPRHTIELAESSVSVCFLNCKIARASSEWDEPLAVAFGPGPNIISRRNGATVALYGCIVSEQIHQLSIWEKNSNAIITLDKCIIGYQDAARIPGQSSTTEVNGVASGAKPGAGTGVARYTKSLFLPFDYWPGDLPEDVIRVTLPPQAMVLGMRFTKGSTGDGARNYHIVLREESGKELFRSSPVNLSLPFEIVTPRLYARSISGSFRLTVHGSALVGNKVQASPDDCIVLEWL